MSADQLRETKIAVARDLYRTLAAGDREGLQGLLHPSFTGHAAEGLPLAMGGDHAGIDAMCDNLWWRIDNTSERVLFRRNSSHWKTADWWSSAITAAQLGEVVTRWMRRLSMCLRSLPMSGSIRYTS